MGLGMIVVSLSILGILLVILVLLLYRKKRRMETFETNYRMLFIVGVILIPSGIIFSIAMFFIGIPFFVGFPLLILGAVYIAIGLSNRDNWN